MIRGWPDEGPGTECSTIYRSTGAFAIITCGSSILRNGWNTQSLIGRQPPGMISRVPGLMSAPSASTLRQVKIIAGIINNSIRTLYFILSSNRTQSFAFFPHVIDPIYGENL